MKDVCRGDFLEIVCQRRSGPYLTTVQTSCQSKDLEKPQSVFDTPYLTSVQTSCQSKDLEKPQSVFDTLAVISSVNSGYGRPEVACHLLSSGVLSSITSHE
jgi:hypothetical protein